MRYRFRGLIRENGKPVEGHVEATDETQACNTLSENGIVTESVWPDPKPLNLAPAAAPPFADAIDSALDTSSMQVAFDELTERYRGKRVWVIDRDKIRRRVAQVVDQVLAANLNRSDDSALTRERVKEAIQEVFNDNRNLASERNAESIAGMRYNGNGGNGPQRPASPMPYQQVSTEGAEHQSLELQIARMSRLISQAEGVLATISSAARRTGMAAGGGYMRQFVPQRVNEERNEVLLEIFKSNLDLIKGMENRPANQPTAAA